jgi:hypothetical protein
MQLQTPTQIELVAVYGTPKQMTAELRVNGALHQYTAGANIAPEISLGTVANNTATFNIKNRKITLHVGNNIEAYPVSQ